MTWISGRLVVFEDAVALEASCAATVLGAIASTAESVPSNPQSAACLTDVLVRSEKLPTLPMCPSPLTEFEIDARADDVFVETHDRACGASAAPKAR
jgi:hypothetical protein